MAIADWTDVTNSFEHVADDSLTHSTRDGNPGYVVGGAFSSSEISQEQAIPDGYRVSAIALLTFQRMTAITGDTGRVYLEALDGSGGSVLATASTSLETTTPDEVWHSKRLTLSIPEGATYLRVRLVANRAAGSGLSGAAFDDFDLRIHKALDPAYVYELDFSTPTKQPTPRNWQRFHLAWPDIRIPDAMIAHGIHATISAPRAIGGESMGWSDVTGNAALPFLGTWGIAPSDADHTESNVYREAYQFVYQGPHLQLFGNGSKRRGQFKATESFSVRCVLKAREYGSGAGICGNRDTTTGQGWGLSLTSSGNVRATLQGVTGTKTATSAASIADGAPHQVVMVYSIDDDTLKIYVDRLAAVSTSTASGMGEFDQPVSPAGTYPLRIGTDRSTSDVFGGELLELELFKAVALTSSEILSMWTYLQVDDVEPQLSHAVWVPSESSDDLGGTALVRCATSQLPIGHAGSDFGIATTTGSENLWPSSDTSSTSAWEAEGGVTATRLIADNTGLDRGIRIAGSGSAGLVIPSIAIGASSGTVNFVVFARALSGTPTLNVALLSSADVSKDTDSATLSTSWQRVAIRALAWDGATSTCKLRFRCASTFELAHVAWVERAGDAGSRIPTVFQDPGATLSNVYATLDTEHPATLNDEGELDVAGIATTDSPESLFVGVIGVTGSEEATRLLYVSASQEPQFVHYDSAEASATATATAIAWDEEWRLRGRWCRTGIPSEAGDTFAGIVVDGSADSDVQDARTAAWAAASDPLDISWIGSAIGAPLDAYIRRFAVRSREPRL